MAQENAKRTVLALVPLDDTVQDASYHTIGHAKDIPRKWAAFYFFFSK